MKWSILKGPAKFNARRAIWFRRSAAAFGVGLTVCLPWSVMRADICVPTPPGLVSWWRAEGSAGDAVGANQGFLVNGVSFAPGMVGEGFAFNGDGAYVQVPDSPSLSLTNELTVELWFKDQSTAPRYYGLVAKRAPFPQGCNFGIDFYAQRPDGLQVYLRDPNYPSYQVSTSPVPSSGVFHHVAATYRQANAGQVELKTFVDGQLVKTAMVPGNLANTLNNAPMTIGADDPQETYFIGIIDEVSLYRRALSADEILAIYNAGSAGKCVSAAAPTILTQPANQTVTAGASATFTVTAAGTPPLSYQWRMGGADIPGATNATLTLTNVQFYQAAYYSVRVANMSGSIVSSNAGLWVSELPVCDPAPPGQVGWWPLDGNADDLAGNNRGIISGTPQFTVGEVGQAMAFDGSTDQVRVPASPSLNVGLAAGLTIETWIRPSDLSGQRPLVEWNNGTGFMGAHFWISVSFLNGGPSSLWANLVDVNGNPHQISSAPGLLEPNVFQHVAVTYDKTGGIAALFLNGQAVAQTNLGSFTPYTSSDLYLGYRPSGIAAGALYVGAMDEVSVYNRALTAGEIQAIYSAGSAGKCPGPIAPSILTQPASQTVPLGGNVTFTVVAAGTPPLSYQWRYNNANVTQATNSTLVLTNVQIVNAGNYAVVVHNLAGSVVSSNALLTVNPASGACVPAPPGLVSWWPGEGDGQDVVGGNSGTLAGNVTFGAGRVGRGFVFDGRNGGVQVGNPASLRLQDLTIEAWVRRADPSVVTYRWTGVGIIYGYGYGGYGFGMRNDGHLFLTKIGIDNIVLGTGITDTNFHHLAVTKSGSTVVFYIDGAAYTVPAYNSVFDFTTAAAIGAPGDYDLTDSFLGTIDETSIYGRALSATEIQAIYNAGSAGKCRAAVAPSIFTQPVNQTVTAGTNATFRVTAVGSPPLSYQWWFKGVSIAGATNATLTLTNVQAVSAGNYLVSVSNAAGSVLSSNAVLTVTLPPACVPPPPGLVSWWRAEGDARDTVGNNQGQLINGVTNGVTFAPGMAGQGFSLNGIGAYVQIPDSPALNLTNELTLELWFKDQSTAPRYYGLVAKRAPYPLGCNFGIDFYAQRPDGLQVYLRDPNYPSYQVSTCPVPSSGVFHHIAATYRQVNASQVELKTFVDGQLAKTGLVPGNLANTLNSAPVTIGADDPNETYFIGIIDEVSIYKRALSADEIQAIFSAGSAGKCVVATPASIITQPASQTVSAGASATFVVAAAGTPPLSYQWRFGGADIPGATDASLTLTNVQFSQAGSYSVVVANAAGSVTSSNAVLTVQFPAASVRVVPSTSAGGIVSVPVVLLANGNENALGFSLNFDPSLLGFADASLGSGAATASLIANTNQIGSGKLGLAVALPPNLAFGSGTQEVVRVRFTTPLLTNATLTAVSFGDQPTARQLSDAQASALAASYAGGIVTIAVADYEGDVAPRPNGDKAVTITDWVLLGRYAARLDYPTNASEFQRADCAPRATLGDGKITVSDWVQAGRYAAGLDPLTAAGGPTNEAPAAGASAAGQSTQPKNGPTLTAVEVVGATLVQGQSGTLSVDLQAEGNENALGFSLAFDPAQLRFAGATPGSAAAGATLNVNTSQVGSGRLGVVLALPIGSNFGVGMKEILKVSFQAASSAAGASAVSFSDQPVPRDVSDATANAVTTDFIAGVITIRPSAPSLRIAQSGEGILLAWPAWATNFVLQTSAQEWSSTSWTNAAVAGTVTNDEHVVTVPVSSQAQFYRLLRP